MEKEKSIKFNDNQMIIDSYQPPSIEVVEVYIEKGFANSSEDWNPDSW